MKKKDLIFIVTTNSFQKYKKFKIEIPEAVERELCKAFVEKPNFGLSIMPCMDAKKYSQGERKEFLEGLFISLSK